MKIIIFSILASIIIGFVPLTYAETYAADTEFVSTQSFAANSKFLAGAIFADGQEFPAGTFFSGAQEFTGDKAYQFTGNGIIFGDGSGITFQSPRTFAACADFSGGAITTGPDSGAIAVTNNYDECTMFADEQKFVSVQNFEKYNHFGANTDFSSSTQTFKEGMAFGPGSIFKTSQVLPVGVITSQGVIINAVTCPDTACVPDPADVIAPGEKFGAGTDPDATFHNVSSKDKTFEINGLGLTMTFDDVTTTGTIKADLVDPANVAGMSLSEKTLTITGVGVSIGNVIELSPDTASISSMPAADISGNITVTLPYQESEIGNRDENSLTMFHYVNNEWTEEQGCTVNTTANTVTCTVSSLSPFSVGWNNVNLSGGTKSDQNCDENGFGTNNSLRVYQVSYDIDSYNVLVNAYSTCGTIGVIMTSPHQQSALGLSRTQPFLGDLVAVYSGFLDESDKQFNISVRNKMDSFSETFFIKDESIIKQYVGKTGYTSEQQGTNLPHIQYPSTIIETPEHTVENIPEIIEEIESLENDKLIIDDNLVMDPEPMMESELESICSNGTIEKNGICVVDTSKQLESESANGGGCLIATATYGSEMALEVQQLRELRDNSLLNTESGTSFMKSFNDVYYSFSPYIADMERENPVFKEMVKLAITPMISSLSILNYVDMNSESEVLGYGISLILLNLGMYLGVPAVVIVGIIKNGKICS